MLPQVTFHYNEVIRLPCVLCDSFFATHLIRATFFLIWRTMFNSTENMVSVNYFDCPQQQTWWGVLFLPFACSQNTKTFLPSNPNAGPLIIEQNCMPWYKRNSHIPAFFLSHFPILFRAVTCFRYCAVDVISNLPCVFVISLQKLL